MSFSRSANDVIYTINVCNTNSQTETYLSFRSTNLGEVLDKGSAYDVAVSYARFPATSIPLRKRFEDGILTVSMNIGNSTIGYTQPVINADCYNGTTFLYTYRDYCDLVNGALNRAFNELKLHNPLVESTLPPFMSFDNEFQLFRIVYPSTYIGDNLNVYFNNPLQWLFSFNAVRCTYDVNDPLPPNPAYPPINDYQLNKSGYRVLDTTYLYNTQNYVTTSNLTDFKSFALQTTMSVSPTYHGTSLNDIVQDNSAFSFLFSEIEIPGVSQQGTVAFEANNPEWHRVMDPSTLKTIDVQFFYTNTSDELFRLPFELFFSATVKLIFRKVHARVTTN